VRGILPSSRHSSTFGGQALVENAKTVELGSEALFDSEGRYVANVVDGKVTL